MTPICECCLRNLSEVEGMISFRKGGFPTFLCYACVDSFKLLADAIRQLKDKPKQPVEWKSGPKLASSPTGGY